MQIIYENVDITSQVDVVKCIHTDSCGEKCDVTEIILENAAAWYRWGPRINDRVRIENGGYSSGEMYLNTILPENGRYRIFLTSIPAGRTESKWHAYYGMTLNDITKQCAAEMGMSAAFYGLDSGITYPFMLRRYEGAAAFVMRLLKMEGALLKSYNGKMLAIGIDYAQNRPAAGSISISADQPGIYHIQQNRHLKQLTIETPYTSVTAHDREATGTRHDIYTGYPANDSATGGRWARGLLKSINREREELTISTAFSPAYTALMRIDITGATDAAGQWLIDEVEHDMIAGSSNIKLRRCITGIF